MPASTMALCESAARLFIAWPAEIEMPVESIAHLIMKIFIAQLYHLSAAENLNAYLNGEIFTYADTR